MKNVAFFILAGLLVCSLVVNLEQFKHFESYRMETLNQVMVDFSGPIVSLSRGYRMSIPRVTKAEDIEMLSQSVGALLAGIPALDNAEIPHQYASDILTENQFAIAALNGKFSSRQQLELTKWVDKEGTLLDKYETQITLPNVLFLKNVFKEIDDTMPIPTS